MKRILITLSIVLIALGLNACSGLIIRGSGNMTSETRPVSDFSQVALLGVGEVIVTQGDQESLTIEAEDNLMPYIEARVENGTLNIGFESHLGRSYWPTKTLKFYVTLKSVEGLSVSGSGNIQADSLTANDLTLAISGSGDINIGMLEATSLKTFISGSGRCTLAGRADEQAITISGSGKFEAADLESQQVSIKVSGSGKTRVWATDNLTIGVSGSGEVEYYGAPEISENISGSGKIVSLGLP
jgi:hypothetical protein